MAGRPALFENVSELENAIEAYFDSVDSPTITGLAYELGFESRQSIYDYEKKGDQFSYTIKRARLRIEIYYEELLATKSVTGAIFALKNFGWADKQEVVNTNQNLNMNVEVTKDEAKEIAKALDDKY